MKHFVFKAYNTDDENSFVVYSNTNESVAIQEGLKILKEQYNAKYPFPLYCETEYDWDIDFIYWIDEMNM